MTDIPCQLPPLGNLGRPKWAYDHLPNGKTLVLHEALFGQTGPMLRLIEQAQAPLTQDRLKMLFLQYHIPHYLQEVFVKLNQEFSPQELVRRYRSWEERAFEDYKRQYFK